jgi:hypothetical protein
MTILKHRRVVDNHRYENVKSNTLTIRRKPVVPLYHEFIRLVPARLVVYGFPQIGLVHGSENVSNVLTHY